MPTPSDIAKSLNTVFGEGTVLLGSDPSLTVTFWPTGVLPFDALLGGGLPVGRSIEVFGDYSSLKSYLALKAIAAVQAQGGVAALVDTEHAFDPEWAQALGVDTDDLIVQMPETGEDAVKVTEVLIRNGTDLIVWDSVAATQPKQYAEKAPGDDNQPGALARFMSSSLRRLNSINKKTCLLYINQTRVNVGMTFGPAEANPGGKALGFYASQRIRMVKAGKITHTEKAHDGEKLIDVRVTDAVKIKAVLEKSKLNRPLREEWFLFDLHGGRIDETAWLIAQGLERGVITFKGAMWTIPDYLEDSVRGREKFKEWLDGDPEAKEWLLNELRTRNDQEDHYPDE